MKRLNLEVIFMRTRKILSLASTLFFLGTQSASAIETIHARECSVVVQGVILPRITQILRSKGYEVVERNGEFTLHVWAGSTLACRGRTCNMGERRKNVGTASFYANSPEAEASYGDIDREFRSRRYLGLNAAERAIARFVWNELPQCQLTHEYPEELTR